MLHLDGSARLVQEQERIDSFAGAIISGLILVERPKGDFPSLSSHNLLRSAPNSLIEGGHEL